MKANYVKNQANSALKAGNARDAYIKWAPGDFSVGDRKLDEFLPTKPRYTECLNLVPPKYEQLHVVYSNRSLAYAKVRKLRYLSSGPNRWAFVPIGEEVWAGFNRCAGGVWSAAGMAQSMVA